MLGLRPNAILTRGRLHSINASIVKAPPHHVKVPAPPPLVTRRDISLAGWIRKRKRPHKLPGGSQQRQQDANHEALPSIHRHPKQPEGEAKLSSSSSSPFSLQRFFNPWKTLADICPSEEMLSDKVENTTRTFGIVAAMMGSLAAALLTLNPYDGYDANREPVPRNQDHDHDHDSRDHDDDYYYNSSGFGERMKYHHDHHHQQQTHYYHNNNNNKNYNTINEFSHMNINNNTLNNNPEKNGKNSTIHQTPAPFSPLLQIQKQSASTSSSTIPSFIEHVTFTQHISGTSLLVSWGILPPSKLNDIYTACCAGSFYAGVGTTVLSSIINAWLAATPPGGVREFVRVHSWYIVSMPALLGVSTGLAGGALFIGLDRAHGTPVSYIGLVGTVAGGLLLAIVTGRGWMCTYRSLTQAVIRSRKKGI